MADIIDISPSLSSSIAVWPGDQPYERSVSLDNADGDHLTLSSICTTVHVGAHADAPSHYALGGESIDERDLSLYLGSCQVIAVDGQRGERLMPSHLTEPLRAPRVLLKTGSYPDPGVFNSDFCALSPKLVNHLHAGGVQLVGIDTPSIDLFADKDLLSHQAVARHNLAVLEGVVLGHVTPGLYTLVALPLKLAGADASPVRAVLLPHRA